MAAPEASYILPVGRSKRRSSKDAGGEHTAGIPLRYVEDMFEPRTPLEVVFSGRLEVPGEAAHHKPRIPRHEVCIRDTGRFIAQAGIEEEGGLLPFRIKKILHEEERLQSAMRQLYRKLISLGQIERGPGRCLRTAVFDQGSNAEIGGLNL